MMAETSVLTSKTSDIKQMSIKNYPSSENFLQNDWMIGSELINLLSFPLLLHSFVSLGSFAVGVPCHSSAASRQGRRFL